MIDALNCFELARFKSFEIAVDFFYEMESPFLRYLVFILWKGLSLMGDRSQSLTNFQLGDRCH